MLAPIDLTTYRQAEYVKNTHRKIPIISPGLIFCSKGFFAGLIYNLKQLKTASTNRPWAYIREGLLSEGFLRLRFGGLIFGGLIIGILRY